jgi:hypothetical protein
MLKTRIEKLVKGYTTYYVEVDIILEDNEKLVRIYFGNSELDKDYTTETDDEIIADIKDLCESLKNDADCF